VNRAVGVGTALEETGYSDGGKHDSTYMQSSGLHSLQRCVADIVAGALRRSYTGEVRGEDRQWLADRLAAECERQEGRTDSTDRRSASLQLRRRVAAYQVLCSQIAAMPTPSRNNQPALLQKPYE